MCWKVKEACTVLEDGRRNVLCVLAESSHTSSCSWKTYSTSPASYPHMKVFLQICKFPLHEGSNLLNVEVPQPCVQVILAGETDLALASLFIVQVPQRLFYLIRKRLRRENSQT